MNKNKELEHFEHTYANPKGVEKKEQLNDYYKKHRDELIAGFVESFRNICIKARVMQDKETKDKIGYITYLLLRTNIAARKYIYVIDAYNEDWFNDKAECRSEYDASWAFKFLDEYYEELEEKRRLYVDKITKSDLEMLGLGQVGIYNSVIVDLARYAMPEAAKLKEYENLFKHEVLEVRVGEYKGISEVVFKEDIRDKDPEEIKEWLEEKKEGKYNYEVLRNLNLSGGDYGEIDLMYGDLSGSNLSGSSMNKCSFIGTKFDNCIIDDSDLSLAMLDKASFISASIKNSKLKKCEGSSIDFENSIMENLDMKEVDMVNVNMKNAVLKNIDMSNSELIKTSFNGANLEGVIFAGSDLSNSDMRGATFKDVDFKNSKLNKVRFSRSVVDSLNLGRDQREKIIIDG